MTQITTQALLAQLQAAHPSKQWILHPFSVGGCEHQAIFLMQDGVAIYDPLGDAIGKIDVPSGYGLTRDQARQLNAHNQRYIAEVLKKTPYIQYLYQLVVRQSLQHPETSAREFLADLGFVECRTGGNCRAFGVYEPDGPHVLVTDDSAGLPEKLGGAWIGRYDNDGEVEGYYPDHPPFYRAVMDTGYFEFEGYGQSADEAVAAMRQGLDRHGRQYGLGKNWYAKMDHSCYPVNFNCSYRDRQIVLDGQASQQLAKYQQEFPSFGILDVELPEGFEDESWHNEAMPSFTKELFNGQYLRLWIDYADPSMRETPAFQRFAVLLYDHDMELVRSLVTTDDYMSVLEAINQFTPAVTPYQCIRYAARMSREQLNDWYQKNVGYRPDDESDVDQQVLLMGVAEMMLYHANGIEDEWVQCDTASALARIQKEDAELRMTERRFVCNLSDGSSETAEALPLGHFYLRSEYSDADKFAISGLAVGESYTVSLPGGNRTVSRTI